jgi:tripartite-type tricarboxylate transporter receptor subunit TctC
VIDTLNAALRKALSDPQIKETLLKRDAEPVPGTPEEFGQHVGSEVTRWRKLVKDSGAEID